MDFLNPFSLQQPRASKTALLKIELTVKWLAADAFFLKSEKAHRSAEAGNDMPFTMKDR